MLQYYFSLFSVQANKMELFHSYITPNIHPRLDSRIELKFFDCLVTVDTWPRGNKHEYSLKLKIMCNDRLIADTCPQTANHCALF